MCFFHSFRYHISHLFKSMWENPIHRQAVICESRQGNQFVKFVNMLMNDTTFLLDECLENLKRIHLTQQLMSDVKNWSGMSAEQQQSRLTQLATDERQCRSYLTLARETVDLFHYLTVSSLGCCYCDLIFICIDSYCRAISRSRLCAPSLLIA